MSTTTVLHSVGTPTKRPRHGEVVKVQLIVPGFTADRVELTGVERVRIGRDGTCPLVLTPNSEITNPTGTVYVVTDPDGSTRTIVVPVSATPVQFDACVVPSNPADLGYALALLDVLQGSGVTIDRTDPRRPKLTAPRFLPSYVDPAVATSRFDADTGLYAVTKDNNRTFATALGKAAAGEGVCHDVFIGASDMAMYDGASVRSPLSWPETYRQTLAALGVPSGGTGLFPSVDTLGFPSDSRVTAPGWLSFTGTFAYASGANQPLTFTPDIAGPLVVAYPNSGNPAFTVKIGAAAAVPVTPSGASTTGVYAPGTVVPAGTAVVITAASAGLVLTQVGTVGTTGYVKHNLARSSMGACFGAAPFASAVQGAWDPTVAPDYYDPSRSAYAALTAAGVQAHRLTISLGANDLANGISSAQILAALPRIIAAVPKATGCTVRIEFMWQLSAIPAATWEAFGRALYAFADANGYQLLDWRYTLGDAAAMQAAGIIGSDGFHAKLSASVALGRKLALADLRAG